MQTPAHPNPSKQNAFLPWTAVQHRMPIEDSKNKIRTLVFEHGTHLQDKLYPVLEKMGHVICRPSKKMTVQEQLITQMPQIVLVTTSFPHTDAFQTCIEIREKSHVPLIVFTDSHQSDSIIQAYELGADAVIPLPFMVKEVEMRIMAILRRATQISTRFWPPLLIGKIALDDFRHEVRVENQVVDLTPTDYRLLLHFMQNANQVISKTCLLKAIWENDIGEGSNIVEVAVRRLRQKIEKNPSKPQYLLTVHGIGYKFVKPGAGR